MIAVACCFKSYLVFSIVKIPFLLCKSACSTSCRRFNNKNLVSHIIRAREYCMIYRVPGFLMLLCMIRFLAQPLPPSPVIEQTGDTQED